MDAFQQVPKAKNEPVKSYAPGSPERKELKAKLKELYGQKLDIPMVIGGEQVRTDDTRDLVPPHDHRNPIAQCHWGDGSHVQQAVDAALEAKADWAATPWQERAAIFLKAADLLAGPYRAEINAATMIGQSKNPHQAEIEACCEACDFLRFNAEYMTEIYKDQPYSPDGIWNRMEYRPLEGFIFAITPFNFTAISLNLPTAPAMMGNTVVWKPNPNQIYSARVLIKVLQEAGLPDGVINLIYTDGPDAGDVIFDHPEFAGLHFTGSTAIFKELWKMVGQNIDKYKYYPRVVGETGGKDFIIAHKTAKAEQVATAISRGAFEFQGQKCSAASRAYIPSNIWPDVKEQVLADVKSFKVGPPEDFTNFVNAVIDRAAFDKIKGYLDHARDHDHAEFLIGGGYDDSKGYYIEPTVILTTDPHFKTMEEEIFGPVITIYVYDPDRYEEMLETLDQTSKYALTGSVFSQDRYMINMALDKLRNAAGNFYINDKPTGSVVGQQPFGGARGSGTNDKAGSYINLLRWVSSRAIKENFVPPTDYRYPFMEEEEEKKAEEMVGK